MFCPLAFHSTDIASFRLVSLPLVPPMVKHIKFTVYVVSKFVNDLYQLAGAGNEEGMNLGIPLNERGCLGVIPFPLFLC